MNSEDFEKKMEDLKKPGTDQVKEPIEIKLAILNAERSAAIGVWFVVVPCFFIACIAMKYLFHFNMGFLDTFEETMAELDRNPGTWWIQPVLLMGLPIVSIILNALSIMHFRWERLTRSLLITIKIRWFNLIILAVSAAIVMTFLLYLIVENIHHRP